MNPNPLQRYTLKNQQGMEVEICNFGARINSIKLPVKGELTEMLVAPQSDDDVLSDQSYLGATCGPVCNRIQSAQFSLNDTVYQLTKNDGENCLHGGEGNIGISFWDLLLDNTALDQQTATDSVQLCLTLPHLKGGFPGNRRITVTYTLSEDNALSIVYQGISDMPTPMNLTNHAYFNLGQPDILELMASIDSSQFLVRRDDGLPTGEFEDCEAMVMDIQQLVSVHELINENQYPQMQCDKGVDHCFVLGESPFSQAKARLVSPQTGVTMTVFTDQPAIQLYTGKYLPKAYHGVCFESQGFTDAVNHSEFPSTIIDEKSPYHHQLIYQFTVN